MSDKTILPEPVKMANLTITLSLVRYIQLAVGRETDTLEKLLKEGLNQPLFKEGTEDRRLYDNAINQAIKTAEDARVLVTNLNKA